jgi:hypothetical protein
MNGAVPKLSNSSKKRLARAQRIAWRRGVACGGFARRCGTNGNDDEGVIGVRSGRRPCLAAAARLYAKAVTEKSPYSPQIAEPREVGS